ncbi:MAG: site-specific DNA-methyltransferase [Nannocystis sp.]|uniref:site-specific DNA-methyltransferase n=1 Tax=Nannocystis sp. TaxID=1962667 RepID=UPI002420CC66|nr:site-specific DNA-methyltransferase [Nannocystis sp.]MBK9755257.1 site-specific DNA-methyltransferase [Nannocystis sp.]
MARREPSPVTVQVARGQPRLVWHAEEAAAATTVHASTVRERVGEGPIAGRLIAATDNLAALQVLLAEGMTGAVDLVYIDPPFMAGSDRAASPGGALAYRDTWPGGLDGYLDMLRARLLALRPLLAATGNLFVHLDWHAVHYVKVLLDEIFGHANFRNEIVWRRANAHSDPSRFGVITDAILFYGASARAYWADVHVPHAPEYIASHWRRSDARGRYRLVPLDAPRHGDGGQLVYPWRGKLPAASRTWAIGIAAMEQLEREGRIVYTRSGTPTRKCYLDESPGLRAQNLWDDISPVNPMAAERLGYPTQKPVALLERILAAACPPDGLVLDAFLGSGTTAEAAARLGRRFIGIDSNPAAIELARRRLLALAGQPVRGAARASYRECTQCRQISRSSRSSGAGPIVLRAFTVEEVGALAPTLPGVATPQLELEQRGCEVALRLLGPRERVAAWCVDWDFTPPVLAAATHHLRPRRGLVEPLASHAYSEAGPRRIAVQTIDDSGARARALLAIE